ncbi:hypothetical protein [Streptomyces albogriseolus]|uniref:hypothetical protein n=1 Tax=Streptomyces albogriseolus TaxID=1887 RepID=UPI003791FF37
MLGEGRYWLERLLASPPALPPDLTAGALVMKVWIALCQGDNPAAETFLAECRAQTAGSDGPAVAPLTFIEGAHALLVDGDSESIPRLAAARRQFLRDGRRGDAHMATMMWAMAEAFLGDPVSASAASGEYTAEAEASGAQWARTWARWCAGLVELRHCDPARSLTPLRDALARQTSFGDNWGPVWGGGDAGLDGRRDGPVHRRRPAPGCGAPAAAGDRRRADRSASVPRRACRRRAPGPCGP